VVRKAAEENSRDFRYPFIEKGHERFVLKKGEVCIAAFEPKRKGVH
jgi:hypothetical protein